MNVIDRNVIERPHLASSGMDLIFIEGFQGDTIIGIDPDELTSRQPVQIDLWAGVPHSHACDTDHIGDTIDYSKVHAALESLLATHKMQLLEALAESVAQMLLVDFGAHWVRVSLAKPNKFANVKAVGVTIERTICWP